MKLSKKPSRIIGVRVGEVTINLLNPSLSSVSAKFVLVGSEGQSLGSFTRTAWSDEAIEALHKFVDAVEADAVRELFEDDSPAAEAEPTKLSFPPVPLLGGPKRNDTP